MYRNSRGSYTLTGSTVDDFLDQINIVGYHDICNYPLALNSIVGLTIPQNKWCIVDGAYVYSGYDKSNGTAINLFELLLHSRKDHRFQEFLRCFTVLFDIEQQALLSSFLALSKLTATTVRYYDHYPNSLVLVKRNQNYAWIQSKKSGFH